MRATIEQLRDISQRCNNHEQLRPEQLSWLGLVLSDFLTRRCSSVDEAFGLRFARGGIPWWLEDAMRQRDTALRELANRHFIGMSVSAQASGIRSLAVRYGASTWRFDRDRSSLPEGYAGTTHEWLWRAFASGAPMPIGERQLRHVLGR